MDSAAYAVEVESIRALSVEERLRVAESLRTFAWDLKTSVITRRHPELSQAEVAARVREVFRGGGA
jgi:hypothetical protein